MARTEKAFLRRACSAAVDAASEAAGLIRRGAGRHGPVRYKYAHSAVTRVDVAAERLLRRRLGEALGPIPFLGEEEGLRGAPTGHCWVVDPLDGTNNFIHGWPAYCVSVALCEDGGHLGGEPLVGVVHDAVHGTVYTAVRGGGARRNGRPMRVTPAPLREGLVATGFYYDRDILMRRNLEVLGRVMPRCQGMRRSGSAALDLCRVAEGTLAAYWELNVRPWDVAAGVLLVREAGGHARYATARVGRRTVPCILAATPQAAPLIRRALLASQVAFPVR